jgi:hypothetical protein
MGLREKISILFWLIIGVSVSFGALKLGLGSASHPSVGFMSFFAGLILILLTLLLAISEIKKGKSSPPTPFSLTPNKNILIVICSLIFFALVLETLGYLISMGLFIFVLFKIRAPKKWVAPLMWSIGVSFSTYFLFTIFLKCNFPRGILNFG